MASFSFVGGNDTSTAPSNQSCFSPLITMIFDASSLASPVVFRRSEDLFVSSSVQISCTKSLSINTQWTIHNCTGNCSSRIQLDQNIMTTSAEIFIPAETLAYGTYQLTLSIFMLYAPDLFSSASVYIKIIPSNIMVNLVQFGTSMITRGYSQDLLLDPGTFSIDPDITFFNADNWNYSYYCRVYGHYDFPSDGRNLLIIDDPTIDPFNPSCLSNGSGNGTELRYSGSKNSPRSSLTILANSFQPNETYQFMVSMTNLQDASLQATGYLLVRIEETEVPMITIACIISTLCSPHVEHQWLNPTTQMALSSFCVGICTPLLDITWNIYYGERNFSSNVTDWMSLNAINQYQNKWFFGFNTANFTAVSDFFTSYSKIDYWRFEVVYSFPTGMSISAINFQINQPPANGSCSITPENGTTTTLFTIFCKDWHDENGIKDYTIYSWSTDPVERIMLAFSFVPTIELRLPPAINNQSFVHIVGSIRDKLDCVKELDIASLLVIPDSRTIIDLVDNSYNASDKLINNPLVSILTNGNQNAVSQVISSLSQIFNQVNDQIIDMAVSDGIPASNIVVSPLGSSTQHISIASMNTSAMTEYNEQLNLYANVRDYLIEYTTNLVIATSRSIELQASSLAQLTQATNQLTRTAAMLASNKCYQLAAALQLIKTKIPYESAQSAATQIARCANNALNAINSPLQQRANILDLDWSRANALPADYETDLESEWSNPNLFTDQNDFSWKTIERGRANYYQKQMANQISFQTSQTLALLTSTLDFHFNLNQNLSIDTSSVMMSFETTSIQSLANKLIEQANNVRIQMPSNFQLNSTNSSSITVRSVVQPLAPLGSGHSQPNTNLSRSVSLSLFDQTGREIPIRTNASHPIELIIPRDPNLVIPAMILQNVTGSTSTPHNQLFNLHFVNITTSLPVSVHIEIQPLDVNLSYLFIYRFDRSPILTSSINQTDGWTSFCPSNLTNSSIYTYFMDNQKTVGHQSVIFGLRELNSTETINACSNVSIDHPPITSKPFNFTANYQLRVYTSGCYYLDENNSWQSDGLIVGSATNHYQTQCYSIH